jgi:parallel beta-helix repeat protein
MSRIIIGVFFSFLLVSSLCRAGEVYTVRGAGSGVASIAAGVALLHPGDTLRITPGTYHEGISVPCDDVTICGTGAGVVLDGTTTLSVADLQPAANRAGVYLWTFPADASVDTPWVFYGDQMLIYREQALDSAKDQMCFFIDKDHRQLEINLNGKDLPANSSIQVPTIGNLVSLNGHQHVTIRGLELRRAAQGGIDARGSAYPTVEYCYITQAGTTGIGGGFHGLLAHNTITRCDGNATWHGEDDTVSCIEENLVVANNISWEPGERWSGNLKQNGGSYCTYRQNWVMDQLAGPVHVGPQTRIFTHCPSAGIWGDINCYNNTIEGNAIARMNNAGIYVEYTANRNVVLYNTVQDCDRGITLRQGGANLITRNWIWDHRRFGGSVDTARYASVQMYNAQGKPLSWGDSNTLSWQDELAFNGRQRLGGLALWEANEPTSTRDNSFTHNLIQVSGPAVTVPFGCYNTLKDWPSATAREQLPPPAPFSNQFSDNYYDRAPNSPFFALLGTKVIKSFADYRAATGWDAQAHVGKFTTAIIGLTSLWTLPWAALKPNIPVAILYDPTLRTTSSLNDSEPLFWHGTDVKPGWVNETPFTRDENFDTDARHVTPNWHCITATNTPRGQRECGWNSSTIPVTPGTTMDVSLLAKAQDIVPATPGTGVLATVRFLDVLGHQVGEHALIGAGGNTPLLAGSYPWTTVSCHAQVPAHAAWMLVFVGVQPSSGKASFADMTMNLVSPKP